MESNSIFASDGFFTLIQNGKPKKIGKIREEKYYLSTQKLDIECTVVAFDFDQNGKEDLFFFNADLLVFHALSEKSYKERNWLFNSSLLQGNSLHCGEFIEKVVEEYTFKTLGF